MSGSDQKFSKKLFFPGHATRKILHSNSQKKIATIEKSTRVSIRILEDEKAFEAVGNDPDSVELALQSLERLVEILPEIFKKGSQEKHHSKHQETPRNIPLPMRPPSAKHSKLRTKFIDLLPETLKHLLSFLSLQHLLSVRLVSKRYHVTVHSLIHENPQFHLAINLNPFNFVGVRRSLLSFASEVSFSGWEDSFPVEALAKVPNCLSVQLPHGSRQVMKEITTKCQSLSSLQIRALKMGQFKAAYPVLCVGLTKLTNLNSLSLTSNSWDFFMGQTPFGLPDTLTSLTMNAELVFNIPHLDFVQSLMSKPNLKSLKLVDQVVYGPQILFNSESISSLSLFKASLPFFSSPHMLPKLSELEFNTLNCTDMAPEDQSVGEFLKFHTSLHTLKIYNLLAPESIVPQLAMCSQTVTSLVFPRQAGGSFLRLGVEYADFFAHFSKLSCLDLQHIYFDRELQSEWLSNIPKTVTKFSILDPFPLGLLHLPTSIKELTVAGTSPLWMGNCCGALGFETLTALQSLSLQNASPSLSYQLPMHIQTIRIQASELGLGLVLSLKGLRSLVAFEFTGTVFYNVRELGKELSLLPKLEEVVICGTLKASELRKQLRELLPPHVYLKVTGV